MDTEHLVVLRAEAFKSNDIPRVELIDAMLADDPTPRLPQQHPRYVAGFGAGAEWAQTLSETPTQNPYPYDARGPDTYGGDPDDPELGTCPACGGADLYEFVGANRGCRDCKSQWFDPADHTRTTNPDGTRTPHDESATGIYTCSPEEAVDATLVAADGSDSTIKFRVDHRMFTEGMVVTGAKYRIIRAEEKETE